MKTATIRKKIPKDGVWLAVWSNESGTFGLTAKFGGPLGMLVFDLTESKWMKPSWRLNVPHRVGDKKLAPGDEDGNYLAWTSESINSLRWVQYGT